MILSNVPGSSLPALDALACAMGPHDLGTEGRRLTVTSLRVLGMAHVSAMVRAGRSPADVAAYIQDLGVAGIGISLAIEDVAHPGTFAEAVFEILAN